jgi:hypothetical protein
MASSSRPLYSEVKGQEAILNFIFNPSRSFIGFDGPRPPPASTAAAEPDTASSAAAARADAAGEASRARRLEVDAVRLAEAGKLDEALDAINAALEAAGMSAGDSDADATATTASVLNNRAQILRLRGDVAGSHADVNRAIAMSEAWMTAHDTASSADSAEVARERERHRVVLQQAFMQRSVLLKDDADLSLRDVQKAAAYGNRLARCAARAAGRGLGVCLMRASCVLHNDLCPCPLVGVCVQDHDVRGGCRCLCLLLHPTPDTCPCVSLCLCR